MNCLDLIAKDFEQFIKAQFFVEQLPHGFLTLNSDPEKHNFGDLSSNIAMVLSKAVKQNPRTIAETIIRDFKHEFIQSIELAGPGFLNIKLTQAAFVTIAQELLEQKNRFFICPELIKKSILLEFVSANPTGPLHFGNGRNGIIGDVLARVFSFLGHKTHKEYYINDAGAQVQKLGESFKARCMQAAGIHAEIPEGGYQGEYLTEIARVCYAEYGKTLFEKPDLFFQEYAKTTILQQIKQALINYGIIFDQWFSEKSLHDEGLVSAALNILDKNGYLYHAENATWFKSTEFGDDKDRVVRKSDGTVTYAAVDVAYLKNKYDRGYNHQIMVLGHDHHSFAIRMQGIKKALGYQEPTYTLDIILYQLVKIKASGELVRMSKRAGNIVTLEDVIELVGRDVARFFFLYRKADAQLEFDLDLALKTSDENPVYYIQYAYVRTGSILAKSNLEKTLHDVQHQDLQHLTENEQLLLKKIASLKDILLTIDRTHHTHLIAHYAHELAQLFSQYYSINRIIDMNVVPRTRARLALTQIFRNTLGLCLDLMGLSKPEKM